MKYYMVQLQMQKNDWWNKFAITADNQSEADDKAFGWARYHSFYTRDVRAVEISEVEANNRIHNEWVS